MHLFLNRIATARPGESLLKPLDLDGQNTITINAGWRAYFGNSRIYRPFVTPEGRIGEILNAEDDEAGEVGLAEAQDCHRQQQGHLRDDSQDGLDLCKQPRLESIGGGYRMMTISRDDVISISRQPLVHVQPLFDANSPTMFDVNEDNEESWPPLSSSLSRFMEDPEDFEPSVFGHEGTHDQMEDQQEKPLSFGSHRPAPQANFFQHQPHGLDALPRRQDSFGPECIPEDIPMYEKEGSLPGHGLELTLASEPHIASQALGISAFAHLRARKVSEHRPVPAVEPAVVPVPTVASNVIRSVPPELFDQNTLRLPKTINPAQEVYRFMASLDMIQRHARVRALRDCSVELIERQTLGGVDLIVDPHCAIIFLSLFTLSARCDAYIERISEQSWKFSRLLIIFEAYPEVFSKRSFAANKCGSTGASSSELYAFTPPIVKAIKKFRRNVSIAAAFGTKCIDTKVEHAFAHTVIEAASLVRWFGQTAEGVDATGGAVWGERVWLAVDVLEV